MRAGKAQEMELLGYYIYCKALHSWHLIFMHCHLNNDFKENFVFKIQEANSICQFWGGACSVLALTETNEGSVTTSLVLIG